MIIFRSNLICVLNLLILIVATATFCHGFPYWSYTAASAPLYYQDKPFDTQAEYQWGPLTTWVEDPSCSAPVCYYYNLVASGFAQAYANPQSNKLKLYASYSHTGVKVGWNTSWGRFEPYSFGSGGRAYTRSVWEVKSDSLPTGTPIEMELSIFLEGKFSSSGQYSGIGDGKAEVRMHAWLSTPEIIANLMKVSTENILESLYNDDYNAVIGWWQDKGFGPVLEIRGDNIMYPETFSQAISVKFPYAGPGGGSTVPVPISFGNSFGDSAEEESSGLANRLTQVKVGDILILEVELWGGVVLWNTDDGTYTYLKADFYDTGSAGFNVLTQGVYLEPASSPVPIVPSFILFGTGMSLFAITRRRGKGQTIK
ncbi:MAG: hypothetical protein N2513_10285 [Deltaproteobacteria bacterium]|nr:hypothetical protein [Deltaproteobacteria bacterium]